MKFLDEKVFELESNHFIFFFYRRQERRGRDLNHKMSVTLEEVYMSATRRLAVHKNVLCDKCEGRGGKKGSIEKCATCRGMGVETKLQQIAPGIVQQFDHVCRTCAGNGEIIPAKDKCKSCNGRKTTRETKVLEVHIDKGMTHGQRICFSGEGDQEPNIQPGDINVVVDEQSHPVFKRSNNDLIMRMPLQLVESLCGFQKVIKTLDSRDLVITCLPGEIIKHEDVKCVLGEGMPQYKNPFEKGRLIIQFHIVFPENIQPEVIPMLEQCLPGRPFVNVPEDAEECAMVNIYFYFF